MSKYIQWDPWAADCTYFQKVKNESISQGLWDFGSTVLTKGLCEDQVRVWCAKLVRYMNSISFSAYRCSQGGTQITDGIWIRRLDFSVDHFDVQPFHFFWCFTIAAPIKNFCELPVSSFDPLDSPYFFNPNVCHSRHTSTGILIEFSIFQESKLPNNVSQSFAKKTLLKRPFISG